MSQTHFDESLELVTQYFEVVKEAQNSIFYRFAKMHELLDTIWRHLTDEAQESIRQGGSACLCCAKEKDYRQIAHEVLKFPEFLQFQTQVCERIFLEKAKYAADEGLKYCRDVFYRNHESVDNAFEKMKVGMTDILVVRRASPHDFNALPKCVSWQTLVDAAQDWSVLLQRTEYPDWMKKHSTNHRLEGE